MHFLLCVGCLLCCTGIVHAVRCNATANILVLLGCRRKKDHGRAEALLLAAWGIGVRRTTADVAAANAPALAELDDTDDCLVEATHVPA